MAIDSGKHPYGAIGLDGPAPASKGADTPEVADDDGDGVVLRGGAPGTDDAGGADKDLGREAVADDEPVIKGAEVSDTKALERDLDLDDDDLDAAGTGASAPSDGLTTADAGQKGAFDDLADDDLADAGKGAVSTALADVDPPSPDDGAEPDDDLGLNAAVDDDLDDVDDDLDSLTADEGTKLLDVSDAFDLDDLGAADPGADDGLDSDLAGSKGVLSGFDAEELDDGSGTKDLDAVDDGDDDGGGLKGIADLFG